MLRSRIACKLGSKHALAFRNVPRLCRWSLSLRDVQTCRGYLEYCQTNQLLVDSALFRGTLYEFQAKEALEQTMNCKAMVRVGGAGDNGVDLMGRWNLARFGTETLTKVSSKLLLLKTRVSTAGQAHISLEHDVIALVQCKNYATRIKAATIRELAGIYEYHVKTKLDAMRVFFFLVSPFPLTKQAQAQVDTSKVAIIHLKLAPMSMKPDLEEHDPYLVENWARGPLGAAYINPAAAKLLQGIPVREHLLSQL